MAENNATVTKKRVGRPPKPRPCFQHTFEGIVSAPSNSEYIVELVCHDPTIFKKIFQLNKLYNVDSITLEFTPTHVIFSSRSHTNENAILITIDAAAVTRYYCAAPVVVSASSKSFENIFNISNKNNNYQVSMLLKSDYRSRIRVAIRDMQLHTTDEYCINTINGGDVARVAINAADYPIQFQLCSRDFKNEVNVMNKMSTKFTITYGNAARVPLQFSTSGGHLITAKKRIYHEPESIKFKSTLPADDIFSIEMLISNVKPFASALLAEKIDIALDKFKPMVMTARLDAVTFCVSSLVVSA